MENCNETHLHRLIWSVLFGSIAGTALGVWLPGVWPLLLLGGVAALLMGAGGYGRWVTILFVASVALAVGAWRGEGAVLQWKRQVTVLADMQMPTVVRVAGMPQYGGAWQRVPVVWCWHDTCMRLLLTIDAHRFIAPGTHLLLHTPPRTLASAATSSFDRLLIARGYRGVWWFPQLQIHAPAPAWSEILFVGMQRYRRALQTLPEPAASLALGMTIGEQGTLTPDLKDAFRKSGLVHLVVLSGTNVAIVAGVVWFVARLLLSRVAAALIAGVTVAAFVWLVGAEAPALRAGVMGVLTLLALAGYRRVIIGRVLFAALAVMLLWQPLLWWSLSFQFTALATLAVVYGTPVARVFVWWVPEVFLLREVVAASVAVMLTLAPLLGSTFGYVSLISPLANAVVAPVVPMVMVVVPLVAFVGWMPFVGEVLRVISSMLLFFIADVASLAAQLPGAVVPTPFFTSWVMVIYYVALLIVWFFLRRPCAEGEGTEWIEEAKV